MTVREFLSKNRLTVKDISPLINYKPGAIENALNGSNVASPAFRQACEIMTAGQVKAESVDDWRL